MVETLRHGGDMSNLQLSFSCLLGLEQPLTVDGVVEECKPDLYSDISIQLTYDCNDSMLDLAF